jgi:acyl dehydratase
MDVDVSYESVLRFPALAYATGRNRELLNLSSMGRFAVHPSLSFSLLPHLTVDQVVSLSLCRGVSSLRDGCSLCLRGYR